MAFEKEYLIKNLKEIGEGNQDSFKEFYDEYGAIIGIHAKKYVYALNSYSGGMYDYEDICNEIWIEIIEGLHKFDPEKSSMTTWLYMICGYRPAYLIRTFKTKKRNGHNEHNSESLNKIYGEDNGLELIDLFFDPKNSDFDTSLVSYDKVVEVTYKFKGFIDQLKNDQRLVYYHLLSGLTQKESSDILGVSQAQISRIRAKITERTIHIFNSKVKINMINAYTYINDIMINVEDIDICTKHNCSYESLKITKLMLNNIDIYQSDFAV